MAGRSVGAAEPTHPREKAFCSMTLPAASRPVPAVQRQAAGLHLMGDLHGCRCDSRLLHDAAHLEAFCKQSVAAAGLTPVGSLFHSFGAGGGVTGVVVLAESHLSVHTWPESGYVTLDVFVCNHSADNGPKAQQLFDALQAAFNPCEPHLRRVERA